MALVNYPRAPYLNAYGVLAWASHPYLDGVGAEAAVVMSDNLGARDIIKNAACTVNGVPFRVAIPIMGNCLNGDGNGDGIQLTGRTAMANVDCTLVMVAQASGVTFRGMGTSTATNAGYLIEIDGTPAMRFTLGSVVQGSAGPVLSTGVPYFMAATYRASDGAAFLLARNLKTQALLTSSMTITGPAVNGDGLFNLGGSTVFSTSMWNGYISMGVWGFRYASTTLLTEWSLNPYGFLGVVSEKVARPLTSVSISGGYQVTVG